MGSITSGGIIVFKDYTINLSNPRNLWLTLVSSELLLIGLLFVLITR